MKQVAKLLMVDRDGKYLLMRRSDHPRFGQDADLPGGTLEDGETLVEGLLREVKEEAGVDIHEGDVEELHASTEYSSHGTLHALFVTKRIDRPEITMSWEHSSYGWLDREAFLKEARNAKDTYMHMVYDALK